MQEIYTFKMATVVTVMVMVVPVHCVACLSVTECSVMTVRVIVC